MASMDRRAFGAMSSNVHRGTALITGAACDIGTVYADRLAQRGHDLMLVGRDRDYLCALACHITDYSHRSIEVVTADLTTEQGLRLVEQMLACDASVTMLVNNAAISN
jgi:short-subunit dehydrogenase